MSLLWEETACSVGTELLQGQQTKQNKRKKYHIFKLVENFEIILRWLYNANSFLTIWASKDTGFLWESKSLTAYFVSVR